MPAVHKSQQKKGKSRSAGGAEYEYNRRLDAITKAMEADEEIIFGRITKKYRYDRALVSFYDPNKKQMNEAQVNIPYKNLDRLKGGLGSFVVIVKEGKEYEVFLILSDEDARKNSSRFHKSILNFSYGGGSSSEFDECGIEFVADEPATKEEEEEKKNKKDKVSKHTERVLREEVGDDDVDVDTI